MSTIRECKCKRARTINSEQLWELEKRIKLFGTENSWIQFELSKLGLKYDLSSMSEL